MSETMKDKNIPNPNEENNGAEPAKAGAQKDGKKGEQDKQFFLVRWAKAAADKTREVVKEVKEHPILIAVSAALGTAAGAAATYKIMSHANAPQAEPVDEPAMIPAGEEPTEEQDNEATTTEVEYVDIPK
jgi:hypothetical protein